LPSTCFIFSRVLMKRTSTLLLRILILWWKALSGGFPIPHETPGRNDARRKFQLGPAPSPNDSPWSDVTITRVLFRSYRYNTVVTISTALHRSLRIWGQGVGSFASILISSGFSSPVIAHRAAMHMDFLLSPSRI